MKFKAKVLRFHMIPDVRGKLTPSIILTDIREVSTNFLVARQQECKMGKILVSARLHRNDVIEFEGLFSVDQIKYIRNVKKVMPPAKPKDCYVVELLEPGEERPSLRQDENLWSKRKRRRMQAKKNNKSSHSNKTKL